MYDYTGGLNVIEIDNNFLNFNIFPGKISKVFQTDINFFDNLNSFLENCNAVFICNTETIEILTSIEYFNGDHIVDGVSQYEILRNQYKISGWVKQDKFGYSIIKNQILFRLSINQDYSDHNLIGNKLLYVIYIQNENQDLIGIEIHTYSYDMPIKSKTYTTSPGVIQKVLDKKYGELLNKWHFFQFEVGSNLNQGQPIYRIYFPSEDTHTQIVWDQEIHYFKNTMLYYHLGGDDIYYHNFQGYLSNWKLQTFCFEFDSTLDIPCDYTCLTCKGPTNFDCLSCHINSHRLYSDLGYSCLCEYGFYEIPGNPVCQNYLEEIQTLQLIYQENECYLEGYFNCDEQNIQCEYGYFQYNKQCIKCPLNENYKFLMDCSNCLIYPDQFASTLLCEEKYLSNSESEIFIRDWKYIDEKQLYQMHITADNKHYLQIAAGLTNYKCKSGLYMDENNNCQSCIENCQFCNGPSTYLCTQCYMGYKKSLFGNCVECENCRLCSTENNEEICLLAAFCKPLQYWKDKKCYNCGLYCQTCNQDQCFTCFNETKYYVRLDRQSCGICSIENCKYCFEYLYLGGYYYTSFESSIYLGFYDQYQTFIGCAECYPGYAFSLITNKCEIQSEDTKDCDSGVYDYQDTFICLKSTLLTTSIQNNDCSDMLNCYQCIKQYTYQIMNFCVVCQDGYYSEWLTGICQPCPESCKVCVQQHGDRNDYWKSEIKAFYLFVLNPSKEYNDFEYYGIIKEQLQVLCLQCYNNYLLHKNICYSGCSEDCLDCRIIEQNQEPKILAKCFKCRANQYGPVRSLVSGQLNQCQMCAPYCSLCIPRSTEEIKKINGYFNMDSPYNYFTNKCLLKSESQNEIINILPTTLNVINCKNLNKCNKSIVSRYNVYCSNYYTDPNDLEKKQTLSFINTFIMGELLTYEVSQLYLYLNEQTIQEFTYDLEMKCQQPCIQEAGFYSVIQTNLQKNVFHLAKVNLHVYSKSNQCAFLQSRPFYINNYKSVLFKNILFQSVLYAISYEQKVVNVLFQINNQFDTIMITFENCSFTQKKIAIPNYLTITSNRPQHTKLLNLNLYNLQVQQSKIFNLQPTDDTIISSLIVHNFKLSNSEFKNTTLFYFNALTYNLKYSILFENVSIIDTNFTQNSLFINLEFEKSYQIEHVELRNFYLENVIFKDQSTFINLLSCKNLSLTNFTLKNILMNDNSAFLLANNFTINEISLENTFLNSSYFISNQQSNTYLINQYKNTKTFEIYGIRFINNKYSNEKSFIYLIRQFETENIVFKIQNLLFSNNNYYKLDSGTQYFYFTSYKQALIYIECSSCQFLDIEIKRGVGNPEIAIMKSTNLLIQNFNVEQYDQLHNKDRFLHSSFNCISQYNYLDLYFVLYIGQFHKVHLMEILINKLIVKDYPLILFEGQSLTEQVLSGIIMIQNSYFKDNFLITTKLNVYSTIISIKTQQQTYIKFEDVNFINNWLNKYEDEVQLHSSTTILVETFQGEIILSNTNFTSNILTNSSDSVMFIKTQNLIFQDCHFINQNKLNIDLIRNNILLDLNQNNLELPFDKIFQILSLGGNGNLFVNSLKFLDSSINNSIALQGGGFYIATTSQGEIQIINSQFFSTQTILNGYSFSLGGLLYLDAQNSRLDFKLENSSIFRSYSRTEGGAIFINPSRIENQITINNVSFISSFSFKYSIMTYSPNQQSSLQSKIIFNNSRFQNNQSEFNQYIKLVEDLSTQEIYPYQIDNPSIHIYYCDFTLLNSIFSQIHYANLMQIENGRDILIENVTVSDCQVFNSPLIKISLLNNLPGQLVMRKINIQQITQYINSDILPCKNNQKEKINKLVCPIDNNKIIYKPEIEFQQDDLTYQLNCNLNMLYSEISNKFALVELKDFTQQHQINIFNFDISLNLCDNCYYGLITIQQIEFNSVNLKINEIIMQNNTCGIIGCLSILNNFDESVLDFSESSRLLSERNINLLENYVDFNISAKITNSLFKNNNASYGGGSFFANLNIYIDNCIFLNNLAQKSGGAIYFFSTQNKLLLTNTEILNNSAQIAGGIYVSDEYINQHKDFNLLLKDNIGKQFANNIFEYPIQLLFSQKQNIIQNNQILLKNTTTIIDQVLIQPYSYYGSIEQSKVLLYPSGIPIAEYQYFDSSTNQYIPYNLHFRIIATNSINEKMSNLSESTCQIFASKIDTSIVQDYNNLQLDEKETSRYLSNNKQQFNTDTGDFNFDNLIIYFNPIEEDQYNLQLAIRCKIVQIPQYSEEFPYGITSVIKNYLLLLKLRTFKCQLGEYLNIISGGCVQCDISQNQYSVSFNASKCDTKDEIKMKNIQPAMIELRPGYWRAFYYSNYIEECYHLHLNCLGGWFAGDSSCALGHIGALCEQCDLYDLTGNGQYSQSNKYACYSCEDMAGNLVNIAIVICWTLLSVFLSVNSTLKMIEDLIKYSRLRTLGKFYLFESASTSVLIKVFTNYLQIISSIATFQLSIPNGITLAFTSVGNPIESMAFSLDCYLVQASEVPIHYLRLVWGFFMIGIYIFTYLFIHLILQVFINKQQLTITFIVTTLIYIYIYLSPNLFGGLISLLSYRSISNIKWISANVAYQYETSLHYKWLIIFVTPAFLVIGVILPLFFWFIVYYYRKRLDEPKIRKVWGYLYNEYKLSSYYWETIKIMSKEFIILVLIYYEDYIPIKALLIFFILHIYGKLTNQYKPYQIGDLNNIDSLQTSICKISILLASLIFTAQNLSISEVIFPSYTILAVINFAFTLKIIYKIFFAYFEKLQVQIDSIKIYLSYRLPSFIKKNKFCAILLKNTSERKQIIRQRFLMIKAYLFAEARSLIQYKESQKQTSKTSRRKYDVGTYDNYSASPQNKNKIVRLNTNYNSSRFTLNIKQSSSLN
ncbi:unnamed protein product [Paramecium pentaurelia]|uniref:Uncharacterized protein n=1 Tax=Paramecium pentaurelia TaxID=43138 RepID=A0A8S1SVL0_9CILI|nr:unnamed protein product [Paramecium pentaurelia]